MQNITLRIIGAALVIALLSAGPLFAWGESNPRAMAMGGAYTALGIGIEASATNPANLGLSRNQSFSFDLVSVGLSVKNNSFSLGDYNEYNGQFLTDSDKNDILAKIPAEGLKLNVLTEAAGLNFSVGRLAFSFRGLGASKVNFDKDPFELLLFGNAVKSEVNLDDTRGEAYAIGDGAISYGHPLMKWADGELAIGATFHYLYGIAHEKITYAQGGVRTTEEGFVGNGEMIVRSSLGGQGTAFDLGVALVFREDWVFSASWQNIYSKINWNNETEEMRFIFDMQPINFDNLADEDSDSLVESSDTTYAVPGFSSTLPTVVKLGLARSYKKLTWAVDWEQGTSSGASQAITPRVSGGLEYRLVNFFPVRIGTSFGGDRGTIYSTGFGLYMGPMHIDMAIANNGSFSPSKTKGVHFAFGMGLRF
ncbi:MAG: hypothetical protein GY839_01120 [candidate division Zixibacteria bacterium]|nr:hypothetical protein [candidate division Zixibacteria bacterium]